MWRRLGTGERRATMAPAYGLTVGTIANMAIPALSGVTGAGVVDYLLPGLRNASDPLRATPPASLARARCLRRPLIAPPTDDKREPSSNWRLW